MKILITKGKNVDDPDAILNFVAGQISVMPRKGGAALASLPYPQVAHAAYIHAKDPVWEAGLAAPTEKLNYPGILRGAHHWLTLQSLTSFIILRLDDATWSHVLSTVEARTGIKVDHRAPGK